MYVGFVGDFSFRLRLFVEVKAQLCSDTACSPRSKNNLFQTKHKAWYLLAIKAFTYCPNSFGSHLDDNLKGHFHFGHSPIRDKPNKNRLILIKNDNTLRNAINSNKLCFCQHNHMKKF